MDNNKDYSTTNVVVFTQQCYSGLKNRFDDAYDEMVKYAADNNLAKPQKQNLLNRLFKDGLENFSAEDFFNEK